MAYKYKVVWRRKPGTEDGKYYASVSAEKKLSLNKLANEIADLTSINRLMVKDVLKCLVEVLPQNLKKGCSVSLGEFGSFILTAKSQGHEDETKVDEKSIKSIRPRFIPGIALRRQVSDIVFEKVD